MPLVTSNHFFEILPLKFKVNINSVHSLSRHLEKLGSPTVCDNSSLRTYYFPNCLLFVVQSISRRRTFRNIKWWKKIQSMWEQEAMQKVSLKVPRFSFVSIILPTLHIHCFIYHRRYTFSATDSVVNPLNTELNPTCQ